MPQLVAGFLGEPWSSAGPPTLVIGGSRDPVVSPASLVDFYDAILPSRLQLEVTGADHVNLIESFRVEPDPLLAPTVAALEVFCDAYLGNEHEIAAAFAALDAAGHPVRLDF